LLVHILKAALRTEAGLTSTLEALHGFVGGMKKGGRGHGILALLAGERFALDKKGASPRPGGLAHLWRLRLVGVLHVAFPQPFWFHHMRVGIDNFESVAHGQFTSSFL